MLPNEIYFQRNRGEWDWDVQLRLLSWKGLWAAPLSWPNKMRILLAIISQIHLGKFKMRTFVDFPEGSKVVKHTTQLYKWGIRSLRSEKVFDLDSDGYHMKLEGVEYYWPFLNKAHPFEATTGKVDSSAVKASYKMPLLGLPCDCQIEMSLEKGEIELQNSWFYARYTLTKKSFEKLKSRFHG